MAGALDWIAGAGIPIISGIADSIAGNANAQAARDAFKSRYQDTVRDMRKAGLNPALAYGQGGGNPQTHDRPLPGEQVSKSAQMVGSASQARANAELTKAQTELLLAQKADLIDQVKLRNAQIATDTATSGAQGGLAMRNQDKVNAEIRSLQLDNDFKKATFDDRVKMLQRQLVAQGITNQTAGIERYLRSLDVPEAEALANYWRSIVGKASPYLNTAGDLIKNAIPRLNISTGDKTLNFPTRRGK